MAMKYAFAQLDQNILTRKFGGTTAGVADPYVTGYHFIWFDHIPAALPNYTLQGGVNNPSSGSGTSSGLNTTADIGKVMAASCLSVTPPGGTLNKVEFTGLGGVKWAVPGNIDYGNSVSVKFLEFNRTPILDIMHGWVKLIRDYRTGISDVAGAAGDGDNGSGYSKSTYAALMYYWTTAPDARTVEYYAVYDGVFPTKDPQDLYTSDVETVGRLDVEIEFNVDYAWHEPWVRTKCQAFANTFANAANEVVNEYGVTESNSSQGPA